MFRAFLFLCFVDMSTGKTPQKLLELNPVKLRVKNDQVKAPVVTVDREENEEKPFYLISWFWICIFISLVALAITAVVCSMMYHYSTGADNPPI